jgi:hypothetical protein
MLRRSRPLQWHSPVLNTQAVTNTQSLVHGPVAAARCAQTLQSARGLAAVRSFGPMRLFVLLMAMYVLVLSGVPCDTLCQDEPTTAVGQGALTHSDEQGGCKNCSPFSVCAAGPGFMLPAPVWVRSLVSVVPAPATARRSLYREPAALEVAARIWQPPRVG